MNLLPSECCILNEGKGAWAFASLASRLSSTLGVEVSETPRRFNYHLHTDRKLDIPESGLFIQAESVRLASDKRLLAHLFRDCHVPTPRTVLCETFIEALAVIENNSQAVWCLKYPTSCGAGGHRLITSSSPEPPNWPLPFIVQEFIRLEEPEVYRTYCTGGEMFGWVVRRFPQARQKSAWVAHARGARYVVLDAIPSEAIEMARRALQATELWNSFGCVDLIQRPGGEWLVLEVGTDGQFNHVDRDLGHLEFEKELDQRVARAFWKSAHESTKFSSQASLK